MKRWRLPTTVSAHREFAHVGVVAHAFGRHEGFASQRVADDVDPVIGPMREGVRRLVLDGAVLAVAATHQVSARARNLVPTGGPITVATGCANSGLVIEAR